jgi:DnaJ-class molecular chaperone
MFPDPALQLKDYYHILEVNQEASVEVIDQAYKALARKYHPDSYPPEKREWATLKMQELNEARDVLTDPKRRAEFMRWRRAEFWRLFWREGLAGLSRRWGGNG